MSHETRRYDTQNYIYYIQNHFMVYFLKFENKKENAAHTFSRIINELDSFSNEKNKRIKLHIPR